RHYVRGVRLSTRLFTLLPGQLSRGSPLSSHFFFFNDTATTEIYTLSLHDALPIFYRDEERARWLEAVAPTGSLEALQRQLARRRSEEHTSELQSRENIVCRLLLEKKKKKKYNTENYQHIH